MLCLWIRLIGWQKSMGLMVASLSLKTAMFILLNIMGLIGF